MPSPMAETHVALFTTPTDTSSRTLDDEPPSLVVPHPEECVSPVSRIVSYYRRLRRSSRPRSWRRMTWRGRRACRWSAWPPQWAPGCRCHDCRTWWLCNWNSRDWWTVWRQQSSQWGCPRRQSPDCVPRVSPGTVHEWPDSSAGILEVTLMLSTVLRVVSSLSVNMQWAAVTTYLEATRVPPQNCPPRLLTMATAQGYLLAGATSVPPTILDAFSTPHLHASKVTCQWLDQVKGKIWCFNHKTCCECLSFSGWPWANRYVRITYIEETKHL